MADDETAEIGCSGLRNGKLVQAQLELLNDAEYSDISVHCGDKWWHCHRAILFQRCPALKEHVYTNGEVERVVLYGDHVDQVTQLLVHLYTLEVPDFLLRVDHNDYEVERTNIWNGAAHAYHSGIKYQLDALKKAGLDAIMFHAPRLFTRWDNLSTGMRKMRMELVSSLYNWEGLEDEVGEIKWAILKGMVRKAHKMADSPQLRDALRNNQAFMIDYTWVLAQKKGKRRKTAGAIGRGTREAPIEVS